MNNYIKCDCTKIEQPIGCFYVAAIDCKDVLAISYADIRKIEAEEKREVETYLGIQRTLSQNRVKEIGVYVNLVDATFPTSIILSIKSKSDEDIDNVKYDERTSKIEIRKNENVAKIIDGQHRIEGIKKYLKEGVTFQLNATIFVDMDIEDQAIVFATINKTQTKVNKSLVYDLYEFAHSRSPQKTCHNIARIMNDKKESPFYGKIKILGQADDKEKETITQATFVESLMKYISNEPMKDRDVVKRGNKLKKMEDNELSKLFLRNLFIEDKDAEIVKILWYYFNSVKVKWPEAWGKNTTGNILNRSTGFIALMRLFKDCYLSFGKIGTVVEMEKYKELFQRVKLKDADFTRDRFVPGSSGQSDLYNELHGQIFKT